MKILLDTCVWGGARQVLEEAGHDVIWTGNWIEHNLPLAEISEEPAAETRIGRMHGF